MSRDFKRKVIKVSYFETAECKKCFLLSVYRR